MCSPAEGQDLGDGYTAIVWTSRDTGDSETHPVIEVRRDGQTVQWLPTTKAYGWLATLTCRPSNCVLLGRVGVHASIGELFVLRDGRLVDTGESVTAPTPKMDARDLDGDGLLDVAARGNDYNPSFAEGHPFDRTYRQQDGRFVSTGCGPLLPVTTKDPLPTRLLTGPCPKPPGS